MSRVSVWIQGRPYNRFSLDEMAEAVPEISRLEPWQLIYLQRSDCFRVGSDESMVLYVSYISTEQFRRAHSTYGEYRQTGLSLAPVTDANLALMTPLRNEWSELKLRVARPRDEILC